MKLVTYTQGFGDRVGALVEDKVVDLRSACERHTNESLGGVFESMLSVLKSGDLGKKLAEEALEAALGQADASLADSVLPASKVRLRPPVPNPGKIYCPAVNYHSHARETKMTPPEEPYFFTKFADAVVGPDDVVIAPKLSEMTEYELELAVVIGKSGKYIPAPEVHEHIAGYTVLNDISVRDLQHPGGWPKVLSPFGQNWIKGKGLDTSCPIGPCLATTEEIPNPYPLKMQLRVNGITRQDTTTEDQIFRIDNLVSYVSQGITLKPGDIISTGTSARVEGVKREFLKDGDVIEAEIEKIGVLRNRVVKER